MNRIENIYHIQTCLYRLAITGLVITWLVITSRVYCLSFWLYNQFYYAPCLTCWPLFDSLVPAMFSCTSYTQVHGAIGELVLAGRAHCLYFWLDKNLVTYFVLSLLRKELRWMGVIFFSNKFGIYVQK